MFQQQEIREEAKEVREIAKHAKEMELLEIQKELALAKLRKYS